MASTGTARGRRWLKVAVLTVGLLGLGTGAFFGWTALEKYVLAEHIHLVASEKDLQVGMTQDAVEDLLGVKPEDRKAPDPNAGGMWPPHVHDGVIRFTENKDRNGTYVNYTEWYRGLIVTSRHHIHVHYDADGRVKAWQRL